MRIQTAASPTHALFCAAADKTRLRILSVLLRGELCVCEVVDALRIQQTRASRHLKYLRKTGLVTARRDGRWVYYQLAPVKGVVHEKLLDCIRACSQELPELVRDANRLRKCC